MQHEIKKIRTDLLSLCDVGYAAFQSRLMPSIPKEQIIGVRTPLLRAYAKRLAGTREADTFFASLPHLYYDENNLHAALLEHIKDFDVALSAVEAFLPYINNWATCDMFCPKVLRKKPDVLWERILEWLASGKVYTIRYGLVRLLSWYLDDPLFSTNVLDAAANVEHDDYYVRMAVAWLFSIALVKQYEATLPYLLEGRLTPWIHNKAIQKAVESYRIPKETKEYLKALKIYERGNL